MPQGLGHITMDKQLNSTACWLSAAQFCLRCIGKACGTVQQLIQK